MPNQIHRHRAVSLTQPDDIAAVSFGVTADTVNQNESFAVAGFNYPSSVSLAIITRLTAEQIDPDCTH